MVNFVSKNVNILWALSKWVSKKQVFYQPFSGITWRSRAQRNAENVRNKLLGVERGHKIEQLWLSLSNVCSNSWTLTMNNSLWWNKSRGWTTTNHLKSTSTEFVSIFAHKIRFISNSSLQRGPVIRSPFRRSTVARKSGGPGHVTNKHELPLQTLIYCVIMRIQVSVISNQYSEIHW